MYIFALVHIQYNTRRMAISVNKSTSGYVANQEAGVGFADEDRIEIKRTGTTVWLQKNIYSRTNHYIKESHGYVPEDMDRKLTRYFYIVGLQWVFLLVLIAGLVSPVHYIFAFVMGGISIPCILVFSQHMYVVIVTIPIILKLPYIGELPGTQNDFFEISREKYTAVFAASPDAAVAVGAQSKGTIKIHVLTTWARTQVRNTRIVSVLEFCASVFMFFYCFAFGGYRAWEFNQQLSS